MLVGSADVLQAPVTKTVFIEDMAPADIAAQVWPCGQCCNPQRVLLFSLLV